MVTNILLRGNNNVDTHDAAQVPPSVFARNHGHAEIQHDGHNDHAGRHGSLSGPTGHEAYGSGTQ
jgi:hypothetical protein